MIKILHYGLSSNLGGIETYLLKLYTNIDRGKFHFDFIDDTLDGACFEKEFKQMGSRFFKITPRRVSLTKNLNDLEKIFQKNHFDILHCHFNTLSYINPVKIALKYNCKVTIHSRNAGSSYKLHTKFLHYLHKIFLPKRRINMLAVSTKAANWLFGEKANVTIINNGVDVDKFSFIQSIRDEYRREMGVDDSLVVIHIGAFLYAKNHKFLIKVFNEIQKMKPRSILWLVGSGGNQKEIQSLVSEMGLQESVKFLGRRTDVPNLLSAADCFIFPSYYEGFPNAVIEAETSGLPCVISDNITDEVVVRDNCVRVSLNTSEHQWARTVISVGVNGNRVIAGDTIRNLGLAVSDEIKKVEKVYQNILTG